MKTKKLLIIATMIGLAVLLIIVSCTTEAEPPPDADPPVIHSLEAESERVFPGESIQIACNASSHDGAELSYEWWANGGEIDGQDSTAIWTAPESEGTYTVGVIVTDSGGRGATDNIGIAVQANRPPVIISLTANPDWASPGGSVSVACDADDPDGHPLSYEWSASGGTIQGTGPEVTWTAPDQFGIYSITIVVTDGYGGSATRTLQVSVMPEQPPVIEALRVTAEHRYLKETMSGYQVGYEQEYSIECIASHPEDSDLDYEWQTDGGEITWTSDDGSAIIWVAPNARAVVTVTVVVSDVGGNMATRSVELEVVPCSAFG